MLPRDVKPPLSAFPVRGSTPPHPDVDGMHMGRYRSGKYGLALWLVTMGSGCLLDWSLPERELYDGGLQGVVPDLDSGLDGGAEPASGSRERGEDMPSVEAASGASASTDGGGVVQGELGDAALTPPPRVTRVPCPPAGTCARWPMPDALGKVPPRYTLAPEVVTDEVTGLMWQRMDPEDYPGCTQGGDGRKKTSGCSWGEANGYCERLDLGGFDDWRLPNIVELVSVLELAHEHPALDLTVFQKAKPGRDTDVASYWSAFSSRGARGSAWQLMLGTGTTVEVQDVRSAGGVGVRCVRAGHEPSSGSRYEVDEVAQVVRDLWTTLTWQRFAQSEAPSLEAAKAICREAGSGWRLPTVKELYTIVDLTRPNVAIDPVAFPSTSPGVFWSIAGNDMRPAPVFFGMSPIGQGALSAAAANGQYVRCMR